MQNQVKADLLIKELITMIDEAEKVRTNLTEKGFSQYPNKTKLYYNKSIELKTLLSTTKTKLEKHNAQPITRNDIVRFNDALKKIEFHYSTYEESAAYFDDVISEKQTTLEALWSHLTTVARAILRVVDCIVNSAHPCQTRYGETPFALRLTGHSQFFPRPITSIYDVKNALGDIGKRLDNCLHAVESERRLALV